MTGPRLGPVGESVGYALKQAAAALRTELDATLRPLDLSVAQYSCMEQLRARPNLSNAELARGTFVSRQAMNQVLRGLQDRGLLDRPAVADSGRARPTALTPEGAALLERASVAVRAVEDRMLEPLSAAARKRLLADLAACTEAVRG